MSLNDEKKDKDMVHMLTRRAQEYFDVFDELHAEGYVTHEEWMATPVKERYSYDESAAKNIGMFSLDRGCLYVLQNP